MQPNIRERSLEKNVEIGGNWKDEYKRGREWPRFRDIGGMNLILEELMMCVIGPLYHIKATIKVGFKPTLGILLHGPPGCGKTMLARAIANEANLPFHILYAPSGVSEKNIRHLFNKAYQTAPSIVFIDKTDAIAFKWENSQVGMEPRVLTQLMNCMYESHQKYVLVIGATNRPDMIDQDLRRPGSFEREIVLPVPNENARAEILIALTRNVSIESTFDPFLIAKSTAGFVGSDLAKLVSQAGFLSFKRVVDRMNSQLSQENKKIINYMTHPWPPEETKNFCTTMLDFEEAIKLVKPPIILEGFSFIPKDHKVYDVATFAKKTNA